MNNKTIFQKVLRCLGINSKSELPKPWSDFCPETFPRIVNSNSKEHNIFKESNREKLLTMISVALCLFTDEDSYLVIPLEYQEIEETRHEYARNLMSLIEELCFTDFSTDNQEWVDQVENPDEAIIVFFWIVIDSEYWENIGLTYKLKIFQFIYDYYRMLFVLLYEDKECTQDRQKMARECFSSILSCDYYYHELLKRLREIVVAELYREKINSDEYLRLLKIIKYAHLWKPVHRISEENCFFGYNYSSVCLSGAEELSSSETALLSLFNKGFSYRKFLNSQTFSIIDVEADIKRLISYNKFEIYTKRSSKVLCDQLSTVFQDESKIHNDIFKRLWVILCKSTTKSEIEKVLNNYQNISLDHLVDNIFSLWQIGAVHLKTNHNDSIVRCANGGECGIRADIANVERLLTDNKCYHRFRDSIKHASQDEDSISFLYTKIIIALLWAQRIRLYTPYKPNDFSVILKQILDKQPRRIQKNHKPLIEYLVNNLGRMLRRKTNFPRLYKELEKSGVVEHDNSFYDFRSAKAKIVLYNIILSLWRKNAVLFCPLQETDDHESTFIEYMLLDYWDKNIPKIVHALMAKKGLKKKLCKHE